MTRRAPPQSPGGLWTLYQSALGQVHPWAQPVVVFSLGLGGVPGDGPVAGQLSGTLRAGLTNLTLRVPG